MIKVTLKDHEIWLASQVGLMRAYQSRIKKSSDLVNNKPWVTDLQSHILGVMGELAFAKTSGFYFDGSYNTWKTLPDFLEVNQNLEIRHRSNHEWDLIIRKDDEPTSVYILTTGNDKYIAVRGWILGIEGMKKEYLKRYGGKLESYFIPQDRLNKMNTLLHKLYGEDI